MFAKLVDESAISIADVAEEMSVAPGTVWRWFLSGIRGHKLESFLRGGRRFTTREALRRWLELVNGSSVSASA